MDEIRVLIAEDSPTQRLHLRRLIESAPDLVVVGEARNGEEVIALTEQLRPSVVSMDVRMPVVDGLEATRHIMAHTPTPVVIVSGALESEINLALNALEAGALAVVPKPPDEKRPDFAAKRHELLTTLRAMAGVRVIARRDYRPKRSLRPEANGTSVTRPQVLAIGASTGGPSAIYRLLADLPADFPIPIAIVQHMPDEFLGGLVRWLDRAGPLRVVLSEDGLPLRHGLVVVAAGGQHLTLARAGSALVVRQQPAQPGERYVPSIDRLLESVAQTCGSAAIGLILTGMGDDGAEGLAALRQVGGRTLAQDATSSTVFGMAQAALARGAVERVVGLADVAAELAKYL
ncbi:MAG: chemotaxis-specific protein-glutamate methyltransferase CheB [Anaerolineae bacterium]|nr:chemotaxis-specific protein-glutamate methyltransferase CheB [Anaerolineae bacterium]MDW8172224.1 chemotaxis-specific protein-glutamate methyltransferase CheB [Anaerolineae bacterium]